MPANWNNRGQLLRRLGHFRRKDSSDNTVSTDTYTWDFLSRLTQVQTIDANNAITQTVAYAYDAFGHRIRKTITDSTNTVTLDERYLYNGPNMVATVDAATLAAEQVYLQGLSQNEVFAEDTIGPTSTTTRWALTDHQGTIRDTLANDGSVLNHTIYSSFGNIVTQTNPTNALRMAYTGQIHDTETGLDYYNARYYDAATGKFISIDPIGFAAGDGNLYRYVSNSPVNGTDPSGESAVTKVSKAVRALLKGGTKLTYSEARKLVRKSILKGMVQIHHLIPKALFKHPKYGDWLKCILKPTEQELSGAAKHIGDLASTSEFTKDELAVLARELRGGTQKELDALAKELKNLSPADLQKKLDAELKELTPHMPQNLTDLPNVKGRAAGLEGTVHVGSHPDYDEMVTKKVADIYERHKKGLSDAQARLDLEDLQKELRRDLKNGKIRLNNLNGVLTNAGAALVTGLIGFRMTENELGELVDAHAKASWESFLGAVEKGQKNNPLNVLQVVHHTGEEGLLGWAGWAIDFVNPGDDIAFGYEIGATFYYASDAVLKELNDFVLDTKIGDKPGQSTIREVGASLETDLRSGSPHRVLRWFGR